jgi:ABC-2 type transport system ATP-binding protein
VFVSSHLLSEMQLMAEHLVVIAAGRLVADETLDDFVARSTRNDVLVRVSDVAALQRVLGEQGLAAVPEGDDGLAVPTSDTDLVGDAAFRAGVVVRELTRRTASLEEAFLEMTSGDQQFRTGGAA